MWPPLDPLALQPVTEQSSISMPTLLTLQPRLALPPPRVLRGFSFSEDPSGRMPCAFGLRVPGFCYDFILYLPCLHPWGHPLILLWATTHLPSMSIPFRHHLLPTGPGSLPACGGDHSANACPLLPGHTAKRHMSRHPCNQMELCDKVVTHGLWAE